MRRAIFPGSFNPFTIGHQDIVLRSLALFDEVVIGIGHNYLKASDTAIDERLQDIKHVFRNEPRVRVAAYAGLTVDFAHEVDAQFILRGVRSVQDFEYEQSIAEANRHLNGPETVLLYTRPEYAHISSTLVRELMSYHKDVSEYLPK